MKNDLTLSKIKNTNFEELYNRFIIHKPLSKKHYEKLLALAICFTNAADIYVQQLGYRIVVDYCNQTQDYIPLYEIAINKGLYPISKFIEQHYISNEKKNFFTEWNDAFTQQYVDNGICQSEQQQVLINFFASKIPNTLSIIAPTSYGKSELIVAAVKEFMGKRICILTSTKALLMQTKKRIQSVSRKMGFPKIIVHPEMYNASDPSCLAVLTQERLLRLFKKDPNLSFDCIIVDEAHEMLEDTARSQTISNAIIVAQKRNPNVAFKFLTPFLFNANNLKTRYTSYNIEGFKVSEYIKTEKYFIYDLRNGTGLQLYDQFLNEFIYIKPAESGTFEEDIVKTYSASKNIIYLNKPADIEKFALALADVLPEVRSDMVTTACTNISNYLQPQYNLLTCLKKGIIYHHGSVPDAIRIYIEDLYKKDSEVKYVISSSTLLSGVNLPADRMFILDNKRGNANLRPDSFKNLVGRICRFSEIFGSDIGNLQRLEPEIYIIFGKYFSKRANYQTFIRRVAKAEIKHEDDVKNILLSETRIDSENEEQLRQAAEFIENYENGVIDAYQNRYTKTEIGKACIMNGINEIDVFANEEAMQSQVNAYRQNGTIIVDADTMLDTIQELFLCYLPEKGWESLKRLENQEARRFYAMMLDWRASNKSYAEMINLFVGYWAQCWRKNHNAIVYVGKWGDMARPGSKVEHYTRLADKDRTRIVNLAIVRIKEEQDFIDNVLIKYVEVLQDLGLIKESFYEKVKYGTDDENAICLLKNGLSLSLTLLLLKKYREYLQIDIRASTVIFDNTLIEAMERAQENQILICEVRSCM